MAATQPSCSWSACVRSSDSVGLLWLSDSKTLAVELDIQKVAGEPLGAATIQILSEVISINLLSVSVMLSSPCLNGWLNDRVGSYG